MKKHVQHFFRFSILTLTPILFFYPLLLGHAQTENSEELTYAKHIIQTLASPDYWGRGYTKNGMEKAAFYLENEFSKIGLSPLSRTSFFQYFELPVNTFPSDMDVEVNGKKLTPGLDYLVTEDSPGKEVSGPLFPGKDADEFVNHENKVRFVFKNKLTWDVARKLSDVLEIQLNRKCFSETPTTFKVNIKNELIPHFEAANIAGMVKGTTDPDHFVVFTAHYDHLGGMGTEAYFPGANDNASGDSMVLALAKYYVDHPAPYTMVFILFGAEEAGLIGSHYFVDHPLIDLSKIKFLTNFDIVGTGEEGIMTVNATEFPTAFKLLQSINQKGSWVSSISARGTSPKSDHHWFTVHHVPSFYFYTLGGIQAYHDIDDRFETLPLTAWEGIYHLMIDFVSSVDSLTRENETTHS